MIVRLVIRLLQMLGVIALQVLVCNYVHLFGYATPMVAILFLVWQPLDSNRNGSMLLAFLMGVILDMFTSTPGINAASLTLTSFLQWPILQAMAPKDTVEDMVPSYKTMGMWNHVRYVMILTFFYLTSYFLIESFSFFNIRDLFIECFSSMILSLLVVLTLESLRKGK